MKQAAVAIRSLEQEKKDLERILEIEKVAERLVRKFIEIEELNGEEALQKFSEFREKDLEELAIIEKALELTKTGSFRLGNLSTEVSGAHSDVDSLTAFLLEQI